MAEIVKIKDFAADDVEIDFWVGDDHFFAAPDIPLGIMQQMTKLRNIQKHIEEHGLNPLLDLFDEFLDEDSAQLFRECVTVKKTIGVHRIMRILPWLMEQYGLRPTQPSTPSLDGLSDGETGSSSTDGVSPLVSIQPDPLLHQLSP